MRIRSFLALASAGLVAVGFAIQACGGNSDTTAEVPKDSGLPETAAETGPKDAGVDARDANPPCDPTKDFLSDIPDASIADGASTTGICVSCVKANCATEVGKCAADCICQGVAGKALDCYAKSQDIAACAGSLISVPPATRTVGIALFGCITRDCNDECAASAFADAGDAGDGG
jgi:hypothetical protein